MHTIYRIWFHLGEGLFKSNKRTFIQNLLRTLKTQQWENTQPNLKVDKLFQQVFLPEVLKQAKVA